MCAALETAKLRIGLFIKDLILSIHGDGGFHSTAFWVELGTLPLSLNYEQIVR